MFATKMISLAIISAAASLAAQAAPDQPYRTADGFVQGAEESGFSLEQSRYFRSEEVRGRERLSAPRASAPKAAPDGAFTFVAGETGWQLTPHKYLIQAGGLVHSDECDHAIRMVSGPTTKEVDAGRLFSPGA